MLDSFEGLMAYLRISADPRDKVNKGSIKLGLAKKFKEIAD